MISLILPSRGRPEKLLEFAASALLTADNRNDIEICVYVDDDDTSYDGYVFPEQLTITRGPRKTLSDCWNNLGQGPIYGYANDDFLIKTEGWDTKVKKAFDEYQDKIVLIGGDDGDPNPAKANVTFGFLHKNWIDTVGYFLPPYFDGDFCDTWVTQVAEALGRRVTIDILTEHMHHSFGKREFDQTDRERWARHTEKNLPQKYLDTKDLRDKDVEKLKKRIHHHSIGNMYNCSLGHDVHEREIVPSQIGDMMVYKWDDTDYAAYCNNKDDVSRTIKLYGYWEKEETAVIEKVLDSQPTSRIVLDIGCHIGWFTKIAKDKGFVTIGYDASRENLELAKINAPGSILVYKLFKKDMEFDFKGDFEVALLKIDIEGDEQWAIKYFEPILPKVQNIFIEVSPAFNGSYPALIDSLVSKGFTAYNVDGSPFNFDYNFPQTNLLLRR